jgi:hypothetical protein
MFAPEGYIRWIDLIDELGDWADRILFAGTLDERGHNSSQAFQRKTDPRLGLEKIGLGDLSPAAFDDLSAARRKELNNKYAKFALEQNFCQNLILSTCLAKILLDFDTLICSSDGTTMRAPDCMLLHEDRLDWCYWRWPIRKTLEFSEYFHFFDEGNFSSQDLWNRYIFINPSSGIISERNGSLAALLRASSHDVLDETLQRDYSNNILPFLGQAIVWNSDDFPLNVGEILEDIGAFDPSWDWRKMDEFDLENKPKNRKRGPKPTGAKDEYFKRYPNEKPAKLSYEAIAAELAEAGFPISARQLQNYERNRSI